MSFKRIYAGRPIEAGVARPAWPAWTVPLFGLGALVLVPWVVLLAFALPSAHRSANWNVAWVGFDVALALLLLTVAASARRRSPWLDDAATATATLLFVDAWFDILTSSTRAELVVSIAEAVFVELPLAVLCLRLARTAKRRLRSQLLSGLDSVEPRLRLVGEQPAAEPAQSADRLSA